MRARSQAGRFAAYRFGIVIAWAVGLGGSQAYAQTQTFNIPSEAIAQAIADFARQSKLQVVAPTGQLRGIRSPAVRGVFSPRDALARLMANTTLEVVADSGSVIVLRLAPRAAPRPAVIDLQPTPVVTVATASSPATVPLSELLVTGSRVIQNGDNSPTPVTVLTANQLSATRPSTVFEGLLDLPVFAASTGAVGNPAGAGGSSRTQNGLNLRGLGVGRTLILFDGHRVPPTSQDGVVDVASVPQQLLQRVDVVTGGVSAVYGSDAITGVVNFIADRKFNGLKVNAQYGAAQFGGDRSHEISLAAGAVVLGGRGHIEGSVESHRDEGVKRLERDFLKGQASLQGSGTTALPFFFVEGAVMATYTAGGKIIGPANNPLLNYTFNSNGVAVPFRNGITDGFTQNIQLGGDGVNAMGTSLKSQLDTDQAFGRFDFDVTDRLHYFLTTSVTRSTPAQLQRRLPQSQPDHPRDQCVPGAGLSAGDDRRRAQQLHPRKAMERGYRPDEQRRFLAALRLSEHRRRGRARRLQVRGLLHPQCG